MTRTVVATAATVCTLALPLILSGVRAQAAPPPVTKTNPADPDPYSRANPVFPDDEIFAALNLDFPGLEKVKAAVSRNDLPAAKKAYLDYRRTACPARWTILPTDRPATAKATDDVPADDVLNHHFHVNLGFIFKEADMGKDFNWTYNPAPPSNPGYSDEWTFWVARTEFWNQLSSAYWRTLNEKYADGWVAQLQDFAAKNPMRLRPPPGKTSLWRTLDSAIRIGNSWPNAYSHFLNSPRFTPDANWLYLTLNYEHGIFLRDGLKNLDRHGNWVTTESKGLYTIGTLFPELRDAAAWRQIALERIMREADQSVFPDGFEMELTPGYHFVTLEGLRGPLELAALNHQEVPEKLKATIMGMYRAPVLVMDQSGQDVPTNDSHPVNAAREASAGLKLGDDPLLQWAASHGKVGVAPADSTALPYAGFYAMRGGWKPDDVFLFFRGGPTGIGHEHEDMLEVVLRAWNKTLLFDPGSYMYDHSDWRRFTIGTASHSTIIVDGKWQHRGPTKIGEGGPKLTGNPWVTTPLFDWVAATYAAGYQQNVYQAREYQPQRWVGEVDRSVSHTRRVLFLRPYYALIVDTLDGSGQHVFDAHFQLDAPRATLDPVTQAAFSANSDRAQVALFPLELDHLKTEIIQGQKDPLLGWYPGAHRAIPTVRFRKEQEAPARFATFLYPYEGSAPHFEAKPLPGGAAPGLWSRVLTTPAETAEIALQLTGKPGAVAFRSEFLGPVRAEAALLLVRHPTGGKSAYAGADELSSYQDAGTAFTVDRPAAMVFSIQEGNLLVYNGEEKPFALKLERPFASQATIPAHGWTLVTRQGAQSAPTPPPIFAPLTAASESGVSYADYLKNQPPAQPIQSGPIVIPAGEMVIPEGASTQERVGSHGRAIVRWEGSGTMLQATVAVPETAWYRIKLRYCSADEASRSLMIDGKSPFSEAEHLTLSSTQGPPPSTGWSFESDDWREVVLGSDPSTTGWKFYLIRGSRQISLRNAGGGSNIDWMELDPVRD